MGRKPTTNADARLQPGMRKRKQRSGKVYYYMDVYSTRPDGKKFRTEMPLGSDIFEALQKYAQHNLETPAAEPTFGDVIRRYKAEFLHLNSELSANTVRVQKSLIKHLADFFETAPISELAGELGPSYLSQFLKHHKDKKTTAANCKRLFSSIWNHARIWPGYTGNLQNPAEFLEAKGGSNARENYVTDDVFAAIKAEAPEPLRDALDLAYQIGQRKGDVLKASEKNIKNDALLVKQGKTGKTVPIQLIGEFADLIERIRVRKLALKSTSQSLLIDERGRPLTRDQLRGRWEKAREAAAAKAEAASDLELAVEIRAAWFADLRAKAGTDVEEETGDIAKAQKLLGHSSPKTTRRHYLRKLQAVAPTGRKIESKK